MKEVWKSVPKAPRYEISTKGRVRSLVDNFGRERSKPLILKQMTSSSGYPMVNLHIDKRQRSLQVHSLVLRAFAGEPTKGMQAAHLNGERTDNRLNNLCWVTCRENNAHKLKHGTQYRGEDHPNSKYTAQHVRQIKKLYQRGHSRKEICEQLGLPVTFVKDVRSGKTWRHI